MLTVRLVPGPGSRRDFVPDVLMALGKSFECLERECQTSHAWRLAPLWLRAEEVRHLVVPHADRAAVILWSDLDELAKAAGVTLWLIVGRSFRLLDAQALGLPCSFSDVAAMLKALPSATDTATPPGPVAPLPADDFLTFRASCERLLTPERFQAVDTCYRSAFQRTASIDWTGEHPGQVNENTIADFLQRLTATAATSSETLVQLRAAQAALFRAGVLVRLVAPSGRRPAVSAIGLTVETASRLRRLVSPDLTAAAALGIACLRLARSRLSVGDLDPATLDSHPSLGALPAYGRSLVEAYRLARVAAGATAADPFFVTGAGTPAKEVHIERKVDRANRLTALGVPASDYSSWGSRRDWHWGVELPYPQPGRI